MGRWAPLHGGGFLQGAGTTVGFCKLIIGGRGGPLRGGGLFKVLVDFCESITWGWALTRCWLTSVSLLMYVGVGFCKVLGTAESIMWEWPFARCWEQQLSSVSPLCRVSGGFITMGVERSSKIPGITVGFCGSIT